MIEFSPRKIHRKRQTDYPTKEDIFGVFDSYSKLKAYGLVVDRSGCRCTRKLSDGRRCNGKLLLNAKGTKWTCLVNFDRSKEIPTCKITISIYKGSFFDRIRSSPVTPPHILLISRHLLEGYTLEQSHQETKISRRTIWLWHLRVKNVLAAARINEVIYLLLFHYYNYYD